MTAILVIRLGALGDFVQSFAPFAAIRAHHPDARITLLTTAPFAALGERAPWFDSVAVDARPPWWNMAGGLRLFQQLRGFDFVYDLQTSSRSSFYHQLAGRPPWSGIARFASHPHANLERNRMHTRERQRDQLAAAGITDIPVPDLSWLTDTAPPIVPAGRFGLLVPGAAPHRPAKRWPAQRFGQVARLLRERGLTPVVLGGRGEAPLAATIRSLCPSAVDLTGRTAIGDIAALAARADIAIGNDTGPMHLAAIASCPSIVLFSAESDPDLTAPRYPDGGWPTILRVNDLADLPVDRVAAALP